MVAGMSAPYRTAVANREGAHTLSECRKEGDALSAAAPRSTPRTGRRPTSREPAPTAERRAGWLTTATARLAADALVAPVTMPLSRRTHASARSGSTTATPATQSPSSTTPPHAEQPPEVRGLPPRRDRAADMCACFDSGGLLFGGASEDLTSRRMPFGLLSLDDLVGASDRRAGSPYATAGMGATRCRYASSSPTSERRSVARLCCRCGSHFAGYRPYRLPM